MQVTSERLLMLQECSLSESQARVYMALLDYPASTASSLAKAARLPRNRLYEIIDELNAMNLVDIIVDEPRRYRSRPLDPFIVRCVEDLRSKAQTIDERRSYLRAAFEPRELPTVGENERGTTRVITGRRAVAETVDRMLADAQEEVVLCGSTGGALRLAEHLMDATALAVGLDIELYAPILSAQGGGWERFTESHFADVRWVDVSRATLVVIVDRKEMLRIQPLPDDTRAQTGQDFALLTTSVSVIHDVLQGIRNLPRAKPLE